MNLHDALAVAILLGQLSSWVSLRERMAKLEDGLARLEKATLRELSRLWTRVS